MSTRLVNGGIEVGEWNSDTQEYETSIIAPEDVGELLGFWTHTFTIADDYTLGDLVRLLDRVEAIGVLNPMLQTDIRAFLDEAKKPAPPPDPTDTIRFLEVCFRSELDEYEEDPENPDEPVEWEEVDEDALKQITDENAAIADVTGEKKERVVVDVTSDDMFGKPVHRRMKGGAMNGKWKPPYRMSTDFHGWGKWDEPYEGAWAPENIKDAPYQPGFEGGFSVSLTPINALLHYPLRKNENVQFRDDRHGGTVLLDTQIMMQLGEFIHAIFSDLGFYGTPDDRDETAEDLAERAQNIREAQDGQGDGCSV